MNVNQNTTTIDPKSTVTQKLTPPQVSEKEKTGRPPARNVRADVATDLEEYPLCTSFDNMGLKMPLLRGIYCLGFVEPSPIQQRAVLPACDKRDVILQAQSGTGKTATFSISILQQVCIESHTLQALVLSPTRELTLQSRDVLVSLSTFMDGMTVETAIGGRPRREDVKRLTSLPGKGAQVLCGTPGRVLDLISSGILNVDGVKLIVLDEVDVMVSHGFQDQVKELFSKLPRDAQTLAVSATFSKDALDICHCILNSPIQILLDNAEVPLQGIKQFYVNCEEEKFKFAALCDLYKSMTAAQTIIFANTRRQVEWLGDMMSKEDFSVSVIHSEQTQEDREATLNHFKDGNSRVLIATDVLARGIDVQQVSIVVNYDLPYDNANYIHRIGRCGRYGKKGLAINLISQQSTRRLAEIQHHYDTTIEELPMSFMSVL